MPLNKTSNLSMQKLNINYKLYLKWTKHWVNKTKLVLNLLIFIKFDINCLLLTYNLKFITTNIILEALLKVGYYQSRQFESKFAIPLDYIFVKSTYISIFWYEF